MIFNETEHTYNLSGLEFTPVSRYIKKFKPEFDKERISQAMAVRDKREQLCILKEWELKSKIATNYGEAIHKTVQLWIDYNQEPNAPHLKEVLKEYKKLKLKNVHSEVIVYCKDLQVAGTIDIFQKSGKGWHLYDIKTSNDNDKKRGMLLKPYDDIPNTKENEHRLQLSMYKHLAERMGKKINKMFILYWSGKEFNKKEVKPIKVVL